MFDIMMLSGAIGMQAALKEAKDQDAAETTFTEDADAGFTWAQENGASLLEEAQNGLMVAFEEINSKIEDAIPALRMTTTEVKEKA